jgi:sulfatase maturation enzyme AslB (radical SAM superfamily)
MHEINPSIIINVTTNGTIFNQRVSSFLQKANVNITVSVDSFVSNTYNEIRVGADFTQTLSNVYKFAEICHINKTQFTITVCPMIINAFEIPEIVNICNEQNWNWNFNTVLKPWYHALWSLEKSKIQEIIDFYKNYNIKGDNEVSIINKNRFYSLISLLETWLYRVSNINSSSLNTEDLSKMRNRITQIFTQALAKSKVDYSSKVIFVVDGIPDILIRQKFIFYIESLSNSMIVNEFVDNDEDTIIDHMCIVAFNL